MEFTMESMFWQIFAALHVAHKNLNQSNDLTLR
jgi:hypothetical protein